MMAFLDSFERNRDLRDDFDIVVAKEGKAADILQVFDVVRKSPSLKLIRSWNIGSQVWGSNPAVKVNDFIQALTSPGRQPVMTAVRIQGDPKNGESVDNMKKAHPDAIVAIDSLALFRRMNL